MLKNKFEIVYMKLFLPIFLPFLFFIKFSLVNFEYGYQGLHRYAGINASNKSIGSQVVWFDEAGR